MYSRYWPDFMANRELILSFEHKGYFNQIVYDLILANNPCQYDYEENDIQCYSR